jgi:hypothetical protein
LGVQQVVAYSAVVAAVFCIFTVVSATWPVAQLAVNASVIDLHDSTQHVSMKSPALPDPYHVFAPPPLCVEPMSVQCSLLFQVTTLVAFVESYVPVVQVCVPPVQAPYVPVVVLTVPHCVAQVSAQHLFRYSLFVVVSFAAQKVLFSLFQLYAWTSSLAVPVAQDVEFVAPHVGKQQVVQAAFPACALVHVAL